MAGEFAKFFARSRSNNVATPLSPGVPPATANVFSSGEIAMALTLPVMPSNDLSPSCTAP